MLSADVIGLLCVRPLYTVCSTSFWSLHERSKRNVDIYISKLSKLLVVNQIYNKVSSACTEDMRGNGKINHKLGLEKTFGLTPTDHRLATAS